MSFGVYNRTLPLFHEPDQELYNRALDAAANGKLAHLQANQHEWKEFSTDVIDVAALHGKLHILQWCYSKGLFHLHDERTILTLSNAAQEGHLDILRWAKAHGAKISYLTISSAAATGEIKILDWARNENIQFDVQFVKNAAITCKQSKAQAWLQKYYPAKA